MRRLKRARVDLSRAEVEAGVEDVPLGEGGWVE